MAEPADQSTPNERDLLPSGSLVTAAALAAVAGFIDAHLFLHVAQVFVANMSGNVVLLGMAAGQLDAPGVAGPAVAIVAFAAGMAAATHIHNRARQRGRPLRPELLVVLEIAMFGLVVLFGAGLPDITAGSATPRVYPVLAAGAFAMGLQTAVLRRVGAISVSTTYESGVVARLGEESVLAADPTRADDERARRRKVIVVLGTLVTAYAAGAALAAPLGASIAVLGIPIVALCIIAAGLARNRRRHGAAGP